MSDEKLPERIKVKVIETKNMSSLIEWQIDKVPHRGYIPSEHVDGDKCPFSALAYALPYGPNPMMTDLHKLTKQLRKRNVWTLADFRQKPGSVIRSLLEAMEV